MGQRVPRTPAPSPGRSLPPGTWAPFPGAGEPPSHVWGHQGPPFCQAEVGCQSRQQHQGAGTHRLLHLLGQVCKLSGVGVLIGIQEVLIPDTQVAVEDLLDSHVPVCERPGEDSGQREGRTPSSARTGPAALSHPGEQTLPSPLPPPNHILRPPQEGHSPWKCHARSPARRDSARKAASTATSTTYRRGPPFSTFLLLLAGKNSTPSSQPFIFCTEKPVHCPQKPRLCSLPAQLGKDMSRLSGPAAQEKPGGPSRGLPSGHPQACTA